MTIPHYVNEDQSDIRAIKPGWYGLESNGKLSSGPFPTRKNASPESLSRGAILEIRPGGTRPTILKLSPTMRGQERGHGLRGSRASCYGRSGLEEGEGEGEG